MASYFSRTALTFAALIVAGVASAAQSTASALSKDDRTFMEKAAASGLAEVELGNLAQQKAQNPQVKDFGARMVKDHGKANDELKSIASAKGVTLPSAPDRSMAKGKEKLEKLSGEKFDREYMSHMVNHHKKDVKEFEKQAKSGKDSELKNFAATTLPTLQEHLKLGQETERAVKTANKSK